MHIESACEKRLKMYVCLGAFFKDRVNMHENAFSNSGVGRVTQEGWRVSLISIWLVRLEHLETPEY